MERGIDIELARPDEPQQLGICDLVAGHLFCKLGSQFDQSL